MAVNKDELLALSAEEKVALAEELWGSVEDDLLSVTDEEVAFAEERLKMHEDEPNGGMTVEEFKNRFSNEYGF